MNSIFEYVALLVYLGVIAAIAWGMISLNRIARGVEDIARSLRRMPPNETQVPYEHQ